MNGGLRVAREGGRGDLLPERLLARLWRAKTGHSFRTRDGRRLRVLYPGRPAPGHGPDFRDAVIELDGRRVTGPVELHRRPADWTAHGHDADPAYDGVVLHVVAAPEETRPERGPQRAVPVLTLASEQATAPAAAAAPKFLTPLGKLARLEAEACEHALRRAGRARFMERTRRAGETIAERGVEQALYASIMEGLGYAENRVPFRALADRVPITVFQATALAVPPGRRLGLVRNLLVAAAGLSAPTREWEELVGLAPMPKEVWRTAGVRPTNRPRTRVTAAAHYLAMSADTGLAAWTAASAHEGPGALIQALIVPGEDGAPASVGQSRARELAVNAVLPALTANARRAGDMRGARALAACYEAFPSLPDNTVTREATRLLGISTRAVRGACAQQGLMHLYAHAVAGQTPAAPPPTGRHGRP